MVMLSIPINEGELYLHEKYLEIKHRKAGILKFLFQHMFNLLLGLEEKIHYKDIYTVTVETGKENSICPHIQIHYKDKSRIIEFHQEEAKCDSKNMQKALTFLENKGIKLGIRVELD